MPTIEDIINKAKVNLPNVKLDVLREAFEYVQRVHQNHYRFSGEPYVQHLLDVADTLLYYKPDETTLVAAFMHDLSKGDLYDLSYIEKNFGREVAAMVDALEKINAISLRKASTEAESLRKMFLSMAGDLRVVLIRMADRLRNMETLDYVDKAKRKRIAQETMDIYVPILARLGIYKMKWRLEDLAFKYLHPQEYLDLNLQLQQYMKRQVEIIDFIQNKLKNFLDTHHIEAKVEGRLKNIYSVYRKLKKKNHNSLNDIFDIFAIRIILPTRFHENGGEMTEHLYAILGLIHSQWSPVSDRFKDYVALPKLNGYQSLHTTVLGLTPDPVHQPVEIQIRSQRMHDESNFGPAAHWIYKENSGYPPFLPPKNTLDTFDRIHRDVKQEESPVRATKLDVFDDRIFVLTPEGDIKDLPKGATPIDFAYEIHSDLGHRCYGAKVNSQIVPLDYSLKSGDVVDILLHNKPNPKLHWLAFVKTSMAKAKIKSYFRGLDKEKSFRDGRDIFNKLLVDAGYHPLDDTLSLLRKIENKKLSFKQRCDVLAEVGNGSLLPQVLSKRIFGDQSRRSQSLVHTHKKSSKVSLRLDANESHEVFIDGASGVSYKLSSCCRPNLGDGILAYVSRGKAVRIHLQNCKLLKNVDHNRILQASWGLPVVEKKKYAVQFSLQAVDRVGLLRDIADVVASFNVNILDFTLQERKDNIIRRQLVVEVFSVEEFDKILKKLERVRSVLHVEKI